MGLEELEYLVAIADAGTFGRAAARVHKSPSVVSRAIKDLEAVLAGELVQRSRAGARFTPDGVAALVASRSLLSQYDRLWGPGGSRQLALNVGVSSSVPPELARTAIDVLSRAGAGIRLTYGSSAELGARLRAGDLDVAAAHLPVADPAQEQQLHRYTWMLAMRGDDELSGRSSIRLDEVPVERLSPPPFHAGGQGLGPLNELLRRTTGSYCATVPSRSPTFVTHMIVHDRRLVPVPSPDHGGWPALFTDPLFALVPLEEHGFSVTFGLAYRPGLVLDGVLPS